MIELQNKEQLTKAIERAKRSKLFVQMTSLFRMYRVTNRENGQTYTVNFFVTKDRKKFGHCDCRGGQKNLICKHLSAAAGLHVMRAAQLAASH